jgi:hypothetical protein
VPATIQEVVGAHLDRLAPSAKRVLQPAAVCGRTFAADVVGYVVQNGSLGGPLAVLEQESLIIPNVERVEPTYTFRHALIQEIAYQNQLQAQRRSYHGAVGEALEILYSDRLDELIGELAFHYGRSDTRPKALEWLVCASDRARGLFANQQALGYYTSALERAEDGEGLLQAGTILEHIGDLQHLIGRYNEAIGSFFSARARILAPGRVTRARLQRKVGTALRIKGVDAEASVAFETPRKYWEIGLTSSRLTSGCRSANCSGERAATPRRRRRCRERWDGYGTGPRRRAGRRLEAARQHPTPLGRPEGRGGVFSAQPAHL